MRSAELRAQRADVHKRMAGILAAASSAGSDKLTRSQDEDYAKLSAELDDLTLRIATVDAEAEEERAAAVTQLSHGTEQPSGVRVYRSSEPIARGPVPRDLSIGAIIRGAVSGEWSDVPQEYRALSAGSATGSYAVPTPLAARIIDKARNRMVTGRLGVTTVPMESTTLKMARLATDVSSAWKSENSSASTSDAALESITFTARTLMGVTTLSNELWDDGAGVDVAIENSLAQSLAVELDRVVLRGSGTPPEPQGILNQSGVTTTALGGAVTQDSLLDAYATILGYNGTPTGMAMSTRTFIAIAKQKASTGEYLPWHPMLENLNTQPTTQVPTNLGAGTASEVYIGDWSQAMLGVRRTLSIDISREAYNGTTSAFMAYQVLVRAVLRADVQLARPNHFVVLTGVSN